MAIHSSTIAWKIPWTQEPGGLQSMGVAKSQTRLSKGSQSISQSVKELSIVPSTQQASTEHLWRG